MMIKWILVCVLKVNVKLTGFGNRALVDSLPIWIELDPSLIAAF